MKNLNPKLLRIASDLHLEGFLSQPVKKLVPTFLPNASLDEDSVLMLAGDISSDVFQLTEFIKEIEGRFQHVFFIPGNHEYYRHDWDEWESAVTRLFEKNLTNATFATNAMKFVEFETWRLALGTFWADGGKDSWERAAVNQYLNDFRLIEYKGKVFHVNNMTDIHEEQKAELVKFLSTPFAGSTVVMTHHMPSYSLCHPRFGSIANGGFASVNDDILNSDIAPQIWIHGHTHDTIDTKLWKTRVVCNPCGYRGEWNTPFTRYMNKFIKIENDLG